MPFEKTYQELMDENALFHKTSKEYQASFTKDLEELFKLKFPRRKKYNHELIEGTEEYFAIYESWKTRADDLIADHKRVTDWLNQKLVVMSNEPIPYKEIMGQVYTVYSGTYRTQGFGANTYARAMAESYVDTAKYHGLKAEVIPITKTTINGYTYEDYGVFANTSDIGWEMIKLRPGLSLKDWIKSCLCRGVNPRVYNPFLPHDIEQKCGLDHFGKELS